jgi:hypothetical protein
MHDILKKQAQINHHLRIDYMSNLEKLELRKVQALHGQQSLLLVLPKKIAVELGIEKGDFLKCYVDANRLIVEKVNP